MAQLFENKNINNKKIKGMPHARRGHSMLILWIERENMLLLINLYVCVYIYILNFLAKGTNFILLVYQFLYLVYRIFYIIKYQFLN